MNYVTVVNYTEHGKSGMLESLRLYFFLEAISREYSLYSMEQKISRIMDKIKFCYHDDISLEYEFEPTLIDHPLADRNTYEIMLEIKYVYSKSPNYFKIDQQGLLPCTPKYDKDQFKYVLVHGFEPTLDMVKVVNI